MFKNNYNREDFVKVTSVKAVKKAVKKAAKKAKRSHANEIKQTLYKVNEDDNNKYEFVGEGGCTNDINKIQETNLSITNA